MPNNLQNEEVSFKKSGWETFAQILCTFTILAQTPASDQRKICFQPQVQRLLSPFIYLVNGRFQRVGSGRTAITQSYNVAVHFEVTQLGIFHQPRVKQVCLFQHQSQGLSGSAMTGSDSSSCSSHTDARGLESLHSIFYRERELLSPPGCALGPVEWPSPGLLALGADPRHCRAVSASSPPAQEAQIPAVPQVTFWEDLIPNLTEFEFGVLFFFRIKNLAKT